jgi:hypothetical protein
MCGLIESARATSGIVCVRGAQVLEIRSRDEVQSEVGVGVGKGVCARELEVSQKLRRLQVVTKNKRLRHHSSSQDWPRLADVNGVVSIMMSTARLTTYQVLDCSLT